MASIKYFLLAGCLCLLVIGCGTSGTPVEKNQTAAPAAASAPELLPQPDTPLFLVRSVNQYAGQQKQILHTYLFLLADGGAYKRFPNGTWFTGMTVEELNQKDPRNTGTWRRENGAIILEWPNDPGVESWEITPWKGGYRRGQLGMYLPGVAPTVTSFPGHYLYQAPDQIDRELYAVPGFPQVTFFPDGHFEQNSRYTLMGQYQNTGDTEKDEEFLTGTYRLAGYQLTLTFRNGLERVVAVTHLPEDPAVVLIDGHRFLRYEK